MKIKKIKVTLTRGLPFEGNPLVIDDLTDEEVKEMSDLWDKLKNGEKVKSTSYIYSRIKKEDKSMIIEAHVVPLALFNSMTIEREIEQE